MASSAIVLPCRAHPRDCASHRYWHSSPPVVSSGNKSAGIITGLPARITHKLRHRKLRSQNQLSPSSCRIQTLPNELLFAVCKLLPKVSQFSLALTCRRFALVLGPTAWKDVNWYSWQNVMDMHQQNLDPSQFWRCNHCQTFHRRQEIGRRQIAHPASNHSRRQEKRTLHYGKPDSPIYILDFDLIKRVMDGHFLGPAHGFCLESLRCSGKRRYLSPLGGTIELSYSFTPKIVVDRLLLQSQYRFKPKLLFPRQVFEGHMLTGTTQDTTPAMLRFLRNLNFDICGHQKANIVETILEKGKEGVGSLRCPFCPTHFRAEVVEKKGMLASVELSTWQNLGAGRDEQDSKWQHLSAVGREKKLYKQDPGNVHKAFELIYCPRQQLFGDLSEFYRCLRWPKGSEEFKYSFVGDYHSSDTLFIGNCLSTSLSDVAANL